MPTLVDSRGMTVSPVVIDGLAQFVVRHPGGALTYPQGLDPGPITTPAQLARLVDLPSLKELTA